MNHLVNNDIINRLIVTAVMVTGTAAFADTIVFQDNFSDGIPANSDTVTNFWTVGSSNGGVLTEANGKLTATLAGYVGSNSGASVRSGVSSDYNFFTQKLKFSGTVSIASNFPAELWNGVANFSLLSQPIGGYSANDVLDLRIRSASTSDEVTLSVKMNNSNLTPGTTNASVTYLVGTPGSPGSAGSGVQKSGYRVTGFDLILDAANYNLIIHWINSGGTTADTTYSGAHGINVADWGTGAGNGGDAAMGLYTLNSTYDSNKVFTANWDSLTVSKLDSIPEPAAAGVLGLGSLALLQRRYAK